MTENFKMFSSPGEWKFVSSQLSQMSLTKLDFGLSPHLSFFKWAHSTSVFHQQNLCVYYITNSSHWLLLLHLTRTALFCRLETNGLFLNVRCHLLSLEYKWTKRHLQNTTHKQDQSLLTVYLSLRLPFTFLLITASGSSPVLHLVCN